ncbi:SGNH hydrolase superfamily [Sesbania bispinosa]|nr:SGNH hydrolase superfamily [Sesbania bispinosa]
MLEKMHLAHGVKAAPTLYIFGDSAFDVGTNNFLRSKAKANFPYYGIEFYHSVPTGRFSNRLNIADQIARQFGYRKSPPEDSAMTSKNFIHSVPTGRFSNDLNTADQIARQFGYRKSPPPFLALEELQYTFRQNILLGVNFASGDLEFLDIQGVDHENVELKTGRKETIFIYCMGEVVCLEKQVQQFALVRGNITEILGLAKAASFVAKALFLISVGSNDLIDYENNDSGVFHLGKEEHLAVLQLNYYSHIMKLYELGARKFGILSVPPIGCCPAVTSANGGNCVKPLNEFAVAFHTATRTLLQKLSWELEEFEYSLGNTFAMTTTLFKDPLALASQHVVGLKDTKPACCGIGKLKGRGRCIKALNANPCDSSTDHLFWDWFHPTEKGSELVAETLFGGGIEYVFPVNFSQLV